jgi:hypothetical protein
MDAKNLNTTSSLQEQQTTSSLNYETKGEERVLTVLCKKVEELERELHDLKTKKIIDETQLPLELLEQNGLLPTLPKRIRNGKGYRPILQSEIEAVQKLSPFAAAHARMLGIAKCTYRKYAEMYGIYNPKPNALGKRNLFDPSRGKYPLEKILSGELNGNPQLSDWKVRDKIIRGGIVPPKCNICGYDKRRIGDNKLALLLDHKDGDEKNYKLENLQLLCYNCTFECGRGYIRRGNHVFEMDPDMMEGGIKLNIDKISRY